MVIYRYRTDTMNFGERIFRRHKRMLAPRGEASGGSSVFGRA